MDPKEKDFNDIPRKFVSSYKNKKKKIASRPGSEIVKLFVLLKEGYESSEKTKLDILNFARENLARYKVPKAIEILNEMPLTAVGKIDKKILRKM